MDGRHTFASGGRVATTVGGQGRAKVLGVSGLLTKVR